MALLAIKWRVVDAVCVCPELWLQDVEWLKSITSLPILLKGIVTAEDGNELNYHNNISVGLHTKC